MAFVNFINEKLVLPFSDLIFERGISTGLKQLQSSQNWSSNDLVEYQNAQLKNLIAHSYKNVPYYKDLFDKNNLSIEDIKTVDDLNKIPVTTKEIWKANFPKNLTSLNKDVKKFMLNGSSGSTGQPVQYYLDNTSYGMALAANLRGWYWMGYRLGDKFIKLSTNARNSFNKKLQDFANNCVYIHSVSFTDRGLEQIVAQMVKSNAKFLRGYPSSLYVIAKYCKQKNISLTFKGVNTTSEPLYDHMRQLIEAQFQCKIFDSYSAEGGPNVFECDTHTCYHISSECGSLQLLKNGEEIKEGTGEIVTTDFTNYASPFIRYNSKDFGTISLKKCSCGRGLPVINKIEGRDTDILITPSGKQLTFYYFAGYFEWIDSVEYFQFNQNFLDSIILKLVVTDKFNENIKKKIFEDMQKHIGEDVKFSIEIVSEIPLTTSGKRRFFIRNKDIEFNL